MPGLAISTWVETGGRTVREANQKKMKLALFIPNLLGGGAERVMSHLANGLASRGMDVDLVLVEATGPNLANLAENVHVVELRKRRTAAAILPLARYLRSARPDVLISALQHANAAAVIARNLSRLSIPVVSMVQAVFSRGVREPGTLYSRFVGAAVKWAYRRSSAVVADSRGTAEDAIRAAKVPRQLVRVIYNPVIGPQMQELASAPVNHPFYADGAPPVVLGVGSLTPVKDFATLIRAFAGVRLERPCRLIILGEGGERNLLEGLVRELGIASDVSMPGFAANPYAHMARASLFAISSQWESMSMVVVEALALGLPVVATNCDFGPREILQNGRYGRLVPVGDVQSMAAAIKAALSDPRPAVPEEVLRPFTFDAAFDQYEHLIHTLTGCRREHASVPDIVTAARGA